MRLIQWLKDKEFIIPKYPSQIVTVWGKIAYIYQWNMYIMDRGRGEVIGKFTQVFQETALLLLVLDKIGMAHIPINVLITLGIGMVFAVWFFGWMYQALELDKVTMLVSRNRDILFKEIHESIKKNK